VAIDRDDVGDVEPGSEPALSEAIDAAEDDEARGGTSAVLSLSEFGDTGEDVAIVAIEQARNDLRGAQQQIAQGYELHAAETVDVAIVRMSAARDILRGTDEDEQLSDPPVFESDE